MNPIQMFRMLGDYNKAKSIAKENVSLNTKITQYLVLAGTVAGLFSAWSTGWLNGHAGAFTILVGIANVLAHLFPSIFATPSADAQQKAGLANAKLPVVLLAMLALSVAASAQTEAPAATVSQSIANIYLAGVSANPSADQKISGTTIWGHAVTGSGTFAYTVADFLPGDNHTVTTNIATGVAQKLATIDGHDVFGTGAIGPSFSSNAVGYSWNSGVLVPLQVKPHWFVAPTLRFLKSSVSGGAGYQVIAGVTAGWGQ